MTELTICRPAGFRFKPGDYIFLNIPAIARYEWHPFTISSAPELAGLSAPLSSCLSQGPQSQGRVYLRGVYLVCISGACISYAFPDVYLRTCISGRVSQSRVSQDVYLSDVYLSDVYLRTRVSCVSQGRVSRVYLTTCISVTCISGRVSVYMSGTCVSCKSQDVYLVCISWTCISCESQDVYLVCISWTCISCVSQGRVS